MMAEPWDPDSKLEPLVWQPYRHGALLHPTQGLELKLTSLALLLFVTLLCAFIPLWLFRRPGSASSATSSGPRRKALRLLHFPLKEFILSMGLFLVLVLEQIVLAYKDTSGTLEETEALLGSASQHAPSTQHTDWLEGSLRPPSFPRDRLAGERSHIHVDFSAHSAIRSVVLLLALSLHSIFEGLAVGLQEEGTQALEICLALLIHKGVIAFSLSLKLLQGQLHPKAVAVCLVLFSAMSPLGIGLGVVLTESPGAALSRLSRSVLEGLATGTFMYITFLEILPHELGSSEQRILKVIILLAGFALVTSILFVKI